MTLAWAVLGRGSTVPCGDIDLGNLTAPFALGDPPLLADPPSGRRLQSQPLALSQRPARASIRISIGGEEEEEAERGLPAMLPTLLGRLERAEQSSFGPGCQPRRAAERNAAL